MSHEVETMAWTGAVPWHGLGYKVEGNLSTKQMLKAAKLDWTVSKRPLIVKTDMGDKSVEGFYGLVRDKDAAFYDVVGSQYTPVQNEEAFEFFNEFVRAGKATMETAGSLKGGRVVWGLAKLGNSFEVSKGDRVSGYLLCVCPHEQGKSNIFKLTAVRVVCNNTLTSALGGSGSEYRRAHRSAFDGASIEKAKVALGIARDQFRLLGETCQKLQKKKISPESVLKVLSPIFAADSEDKDLREGKFPPRLARIMEAYEKAPGATPGNAWGVLNAVTYYADHMASRTADKRLTNAWLGKTAVQKEQVLDALLRL